MIAKEEKMFVACAEKEARVLSEEKKKKKASAQSRGPTLGEKDEKPQTGSQDSPEEPCLAVRYGLPRARPFLPAKGTSEGNEQRPGAQ